MARYVAYLRGVNVGGHKSLKMEDLRRRFTSLGLGGVTTFKASGNVIFDSTGESRAGLVGKMETELARLMGSEVRVVLRAVEDEMELARHDPFLGREMTGAKPYVTFLAEKPAAGRRLPPRWANGGVELLGTRGLDVFTLGRTVDGRPGFPNRFIEETLGVSATTRNWATITGILEAERTG
jgi:uncharacterized protein (DUF1697 family)